MAQFNFVKNRLTTFEIRFNFAFRSLGPTVPANANLLYGHYSVAQRPHNSRRIQHKNRTPFSSWRVPYGIWMISSKCSVRQPARRATTGDSVARHRARPGLTLQLLALAISLAHASAPCSATPTTCSKRTCTTPRGYPRSTWRSM